MASPPSSPGAGPSGAPKLPPLSPPALKSTAPKKRKPKRSRGVVYMSRVPPGLDVGIVRSILSRIGPIHRVWLRAESAAKVAERRSLGGRRRAGFSDGWVEFGRAADAEAAAEMLNGQPMTGVTRRGKFENDLWCIRFLKGFSWDDLVDESCGTRRERVLRVKSEVAAARRERAFVEGRAALAKVVMRGEKRKEEEREGAEVAGNDEGLDGGHRMVRRYRQKRPLESSGEMGRGREGDEDTRALKRLEREDGGGSGSNVVDGDLLAKLFKKRKAE